MCSTKVSMLLLFTLSIILISHAPFASSDKVSIENVCNEADNVGFTDGTTIDDCLKFLNSDYKYRYASYHDISKFILQHAIGEGLKYQNIFNELAKNHTDSKAIKDCSNVHYASTISFFRSSLTHLDSDSEGAHHDALLARDGIEQCNALVYDEKKLDASANAIISNMNKLMAFFSDISTAAIYLYSNQL
ncbi:hypothetical protein Lal_00013053 [Lupinus albus]|uniref:Putative pectinesterase inhibitor domain-containing protein n=1 Tax=Lupinus albus TaxID=3870 RepID=A0A6A5NLK2_LUPAL|nr:putative pectinesterase inhibitor domain-containing protein [Lupinus albus]KAF1884093.1 hypothetical protein Lal_00013053 [Lupinus albus]